MDYKVVVSSNAEKNIKQALDYYTQKASKSVALKFLNEYLKTVKNIKSNPFYREYHKDYRGIPFKKFPYIALFKVDEEQKTIFLNAIFHTSQSTNKYPK